MILLCSEAFGPETVDFEAHPALLGATISLKSLVYSGSTEQDGEGT